MLSALLVLGLLLSALPLFNDSASATAEKEDNMDCFTAYGASEIYDGRGNTILRFALPDGSPFCVDVLSVDKGRFDIGSGRSGIYEVVIEDSFSNVSLFSIWVSRAEMSGHNISEVYCELNNFKYVDCVVDGDFYVFNNISYEDIINPLYARNQVDGRYVADIWLMEGVKFTRDVVLSDWDEQRLLPAKEQSLAFNVGVPDNDVIYMGSIDENGKVALIQEIGAYTYVVLYDVVYEAVSSWWQWDDAYELYWIEYVGSDKYVGMLSGGDGAMLFSCVAGGEIINEGLYTEGIGYSGSAVFKASWGKALIFSVIIGENYRFLCAEISGGEVGIIAYIDFDLSDTWLNIFVGRTDLSNPALDNIIPLFCVGQIDAEHRGYYYKEYNLNMMGLSDVNSIATDYLVDVEILSDYVIGSGVLTDSYACWYLSAERNVFPYDYMRGEFLFKRETSDKVGWVTGFVNKFDVSVVYGGAVSDVGFNFKGVSNCFGGGLYSIIQSSCAWHGTMNLLCRHGKPFVLEGFLTRIVGAYTEKYMVDMSAWVDSYSQVSGYDMFTVPSSYIEDLVYVSAVEGYYNVEESGTAWLDISLVYKDGNKTGFEYVYNDYEMDDNKYTWVGGGFLWGVSLPSYLGDVRNTISHYECILNSGLVSNVQMGFVPSSVMWGTSINLTCIYYIPEFVMDEWFNETGVHNYTGTGTQVVDAVVNHTSIRFDIYFMGMLQDTVAVDWDNIVLSSISGFTVVSFSDGYMLKRPTEFPSMELCYEIRLTVSDIESGVSVVLKKVCGIVYSIDAPVLRDTELSSFSVILGQYWDVNVIVRESLTKMPIGGIRVNAMIYKDGLCLENYTQLRNTDKYTKTAHIVFDPIMMVGQYDLVIVGQVTVLNETKAKGNSIKFMVVKSDVYEPPVVKSIRFENTLVMGNPVGFRVDMISTGMVTGVWVDAGTQTVSCSFIGGNTYQSDSKWIPEESGTVDFKIVVRDIYSVTTNFPYEVSVLEIEEYVPPTIMIMPEYVYNPLFEYTPIFIRDTGIEYKPIFEEMGVFYVNILYKCNNVSYFVNVTVSGMNVTDVKVNNGTISHIDEVGYEGDVLITLITIGLYNISFSIETNETAVAGYYQINMTFYSTVYQGHNMNVVDTVFIFAGYQWVCTGYYNVTVDELVIAGYDTEIVGYEKRIIGYAGVTNTWEIGEVLLFKEGMDWYLVCNASLEKICIDLRLLEPDEYPTYFPFTHWVLWTDYKVSLTITGTEALIVYILPSRACSLGFWSWITGKKVTVKGFNDWGSAFTFKKEAVEGKSEEYTVEYKGIITIITPNKELRINYQR